MNYYEIDTKRKIPKSPLEKAIQMCKRSIKFELFVGLWVIIREYLRPGNCATVNYPLERLQVSDRYRAVHKLMRHMQSEGERCIGCGLCEKICISNCIRMQTKLSADGRKQAFVYGINLSRCIYCGFCAEVCPELAIVHGKEYEFAAAQRAHYAMKDDLLTNISKLKDQVEFKGSGSLREDANDFIKKTPNYYEFELKLKKEAQEKAKKEQEAKAVKEEEALKAQKNANESLDKKENTNV